MEHDFLAGIDEHFERLMKQHGNGRQNGGVRRGRASDRVTMEILEQLEGLSSAGKQEVLDLIRTLKREVQQP